MSGEEENSKNVSNELDDGTDQPDREIEIVIGKANGLDRVGHGDDGGAKATGGVGITVDQLLDQLSSPGRSQIFVYILLCMNVFPVSLNFMAMSFYGATPNQTCKLPDGWLMNESIPLKDHGKYDGCLKYIDPHNTTKGTEKCPMGYEYHSPDGRYPITQQWDLVCDKSALGPTAQSIFFAGVMVGGLLFGYLGDRIGRRPVILITLYSQAVLGIICAFSVHYVMFVVLKFFQGMMLQGLQTANNTAVMELYQTRYRTKAGMGVAMLATSSSMIIGLISYLVPHWKYMQLTISIPTVITISFLWFLPESLRWLLSNQKLDDAKTVAKRYASYNKIESPPFLEDKLKAISQQISSNNSNSVQGNIKDLFRVASIRRTSIILFYLWFTASVVYYGITFSIPNLSGNPSLNFFIVGALETTSRFVGYFIIKKYGRRIPMSVCYIASGVVCIISGCLAGFIKGDNQTVKMFSTFLYLMGRAIMGQCFAFIPIVTSEVFPTVLRTISSGTCSVWTRIGGIVAPYTRLLEENFGKATPYLVFGSLSIIGGGLTLLIPETLNVQLPDTVKDVKNVHNQENNVNNVEGQSDVTMGDQEQVEAIAEKSK